MFYCRLKSISLLLIITILFLTGCTYGNKNSLKDKPGEKTGIIEDGDKIPGDTQDNVDESRTPSENSSEAAADKINAQIDKMTLEEKIGQMVIAGIDGYTSSVQTRQMIDRYHVGGFILFKRNIKDANQTLALINSLKEINASKEIPLFLGVDEEGGRVTRMPAEMAKVPSAKVIAGFDDSSLAYEAGKVLAGEIKAFGFNMDFAPVLDINSNPKNPVIGDRAFGTTPQVVSKLAIQVMNGIRSQNVISVVKHFPGHGDTSEDSHIGLPVVESDIERLKSFELLPFIKAADDDADAVMIAHILFPKVDSVNPASLSKTFITDILRKDMKFNGVVMTDDMTMGAIVKKYDIGEAAVKSINAGSDIILVCHDYAKEVAVIDALVNAARTGIISEETIDNSVFRILKLKNKYGITDDKIDTIDVNYINSLINNLNDKLRTESE